MYEIRENRTYNSREIYFDGKPSDEIRTALKSLKLRWNPKKKCWYGFAAESEIIEAINDGGEAVVTDGYLGGGAYYGAKSSRALYGSDLSKAIRAELKAEGIKGCTVSCKTYSGGQSVTVKVAVNQSDLTPYDEFVGNYKVQGSFDWVHYTDKNDIQKTVHIMDYYELPEEEREFIRIQHAEIDYLKATQGEHINNYHIDTYKEYTESFRYKLNAINEVILRFRYDESNSQVDYFDTNFYYDIETKAVQGA